MTQSPDYEKGYEDGFRDGTNDAPAGVWGLAYFTNSTSSRAQRWYYVARLVRVDDKWYELHRAQPQPDSANGRNAKAKRAAAKATGFDLVRGTFTATPSPRQGSVMVHSLDSIE